jgi:succinate dehydrogenase flavin-adding protein (antitoxin of CptAB toxin-antitoxin module)
MYDSGWIKDEEKPHKSWRTVVRKTPSGRFAIQRFCCHRGVRESDGIVEVFSPRYVKNLPASLLRVMDPVV